MLHFLPHSWIWPQYATYIYTKYVNIFKLCWWLFTIRIPSFIKVVHVYELLYNNVHNKFGIMYFGLTGQWFPLVLLVCSPAAETCIGQLFWNTDTLADSQAQVFLALLDSWPEQTSRWEQLKTVTRISPIHWVKSLVYPFSQNEAFFSSLWTPAKISKPEDNRHELFFFFHAVCVSMPYTCCRDSLSAEEADRAMWCSTQGGFLGHLSITLVSLLIDSEHGESRGFSGAGHKIVLFCGLANIHGAHFMSMQIPLFIFACYIIYLITNMKDWPVPFTL